MTVPPAPDGDLVLAALEPVWESMLFAALEPLPAGAALGVGDDLQATIALAGAWDGELRLYCERDAATAMAAVMLGAGDEALPEADVHDAVGEILNVVGGSLKSVLPGPTRLGLPEVGPAAGVPAPEDCVAVAWRGAPVYLQVVPA